MKCLFCKEEIISDVCCVFDKETRDYINGTQIYKCNKCGLFGTKELWQELIQTRKALDVAVKALKKYKGDSGNWWYGYEFQGHYEDYAGEYADNALDQIKQITAEQKDK